MQDKILKMFYAPKLKYDRIMTSLLKNFFLLHIFIHLIHFYYTSAQALEIVYETTLIEARIFRFFYPILIYDQYILQIRYFFESYVKDFRFY